MQATAAALERFERQERLDDELAALQAHVNAATCRFLELLWELGEEGLADDLARYVAFRCGISTREARERVRVAEALRELPATREAFARGELTFTKVRALTRVATASSEESLLELAHVLTACQLERALRAFRRLQAEEARETHELEYVDYHVAEDGSLYLRARLPAEDGTVLVKALEAARDSVLARRREERATSEPEAEAFEPPRSATVEALVEVAQAALATREGPAPERARLVVHIDALTLTSDDDGRCELDEGSPVLSAETARRLGCDAETVMTIERDGLPLSIGRARRTVPPSLRRVLEARDERTCRFPGCERRRHLDAHHRTHWARGGETSLDNLVLLCWQHHRLVHEGGYTIEDDPAGGLRFRNRYGVLCPSNPPRPPPGSVGELIRQNALVGLTMDARTNRNGHGDPLELELAVSAIGRAVAGSAAV
jgi:hypothetical protein